MTNYNIIILVSKLCMHCTIHLRFQLFSSNSMTKGNGNHIPQYFEMLIISHTKRPISLCIYVCVCVCECVWTDLSISKTNNKQKIRWMGFKINLLLKYHRAIASIIWLNVYCNTVFENFSWKLSLKTIVKCYCFFKQSFSI